MKNDVEKVNFCLPSVVVERGKKKFSFARTLRTRWFRLGAHNVCEETRRRYHNILLYYYLVYSFRLLLFPILCNAGVSVVTVEWVRNIEKYKKKK